MEIKELQQQFLNRERRTGYDTELVLLYGVSYGFEIETIAALKGMSFLDVALLISRTEENARLIQSGYKLYEYVKPRTQ